jgi:tetratricopeptide (TPR) repeat protein
MRWRVLGCGVALWALASPLVHAQEPGVESREMARAVELIEGGRTAEAEAMLEAMLAAAPRYGPAHFQLGRLALDRGDLEQARQHLALAVAEPLPRPYQAWHLLALAEQQSGRGEEAARAWDEAENLAAAALVRRPGFPPALRVAIAAAEWRGDKWAALEGYTGLLAQFPAAPAALAGAARAALALGAADSARCLATRALAAAPPEPSLLELLASAELAAGDPQAAAAAARRGLDEGGAGARLEILLGRALLASLDVEAAVAAYGRALAADPSVLDQLPKLVLSSLVENDEGAMSTLLRQALAADGKDVQALQGLAAAAVKRADEGAARAYLQSLAGLRPDDPEVQYNLGQLYLKLGEVDLGRAAMERFGRLKEAEDADWERHNTAFRRRGEAEQLAAAGNPRAALEIYSALAAEDLANAADFLAAGRALVALGDFANAAPWFEKLLQITPYDRAALEGLVTAATGSGRAADAEFYQRRLDLVAALCGDVTRAGAPRQPESEEGERPPLPPPGEMARLKEMIDGGLHIAARARLQAIVDQHPGWARAIALLALTYYKESRFEPAKALFARALEVDPGETAARPYYGWTLYSLGELGEAAAMFESLLRLEPGYTAAHYALGVIGLERDEVDSARQQLETTVRLAAEQEDPAMEGRAHARLGDLYARLDDLPRARRELELALALLPDEAAAAFALARVLERLGSATRAGSGPVLGRSRSAEGEMPPPRFSAVVGAAGIDLVMTSGQMPSREILEVDGGGIALVDYDGDGDLDVFLANGATLEEPERGPGSRLYANRGDGTFEDATQRVGITLRRWAMGVAVGDYDSDGWPDLYVTCFGPNALLHNVAAAGGRRFVEVAAAAGVANEGWSTSAAWSDLDGDGDLDLYVVNYLEFDPRQPPQRGGNAFRGVAVMAGPRGLESQPDAVYENLGGGRFRDATATALRAPATGQDYGLGVRIIDFDGDGMPDIFVGNDSTADRLWVNRGGLIFEESAAVAGVAADGAGTTQATMGLCTLDADANGLPDLFLTVFSDDTNTLHLNRGDGFFDDRSAQYGVAAPSRPYLGWGCGAYDFDRDGDEDLFIANGHVYPEMESPEVGASWAQRPLLFERRGSAFHEAACTAGWCAERAHGRATAFGDIDGDRDVDVLMTTLNGPLSVLRNESSGGLSLAVRLAAPTPERTVVGSVVEIETPTGVQRRWLAGGGSFQSTDAAEAYFGLGGQAAGDVVGLRVRWPQGTVSAFTAVPADQRLVIVGRARAGG